MNPGFFLLALASLLTACVNVGNHTESPAVVYYVLNDPASAPANAPAPLRADAPKDPGPLRAKVPQGGMESYAPQGDSDPLRAKARVESYAPTLLVLDTTTGSFYDTDQLIFSRSPGTRGQYQFARWTERPGKRFADLMRARLDRLGRYHVAAAGGYVRGDVLLDTELVEFYHDAASQPGQVRLVLRAELVDLKQRTLLGRRVFEQQVALTRYDAAGAAQASSQAVGRALDELTAWLAMLQ
ncbi:MAG: PqiC family protein [Candidatus Thermoplasmatota archaeon]|nr:PqiC family protein [Candidatus Thermoplasmatota archaeon]